MNDQDEKTFYTGMILLGLIMRGTPLNGIPAITKDLAERVMYELHEEV